MARTLAPEERETLITMSDGFKRATIYTEQRFVITKLRNLLKSHPDAVKLIRKGKHGATPYMEADLPVAFVGLRPAKTDPDALNGNPSPMND